MINRPIGVEVEELLKQMELDDSADMQPSLSTKVLVGGRLTLNVALYYIRRNLIGVTANSLAMKSCLPPLGTCLPRSEKTDHRSIILSP